ncbi:tyrosine-type recombinase/integrase [Novosphingobium aquae]|uniref:Integrase arm-type DNA-binding domain-containing protein n=1 Tax=Novosphingobium aquae TaxID=3133435 RepID=A0ABU8SBX0_9SPHN
MKTNALSATGAKNLGAGKHADGQGLWLWKSSKSRGSWVLRYVFEGKRKETGLGRWPDVSIVEARQAATAARQAVRSQICPIETRNRAKRPVHCLTVKAAIKGCFEAKQAELKGDGVAGRWMSPLEVHVIPKLGKLAIESVDQHELVKLLEPLWHTKPEAARKIMNRMNMTLKHAAALGLAVDLQATMKAKALLGKQRHDVEHIPSLPYVDAPKFYQWLGTKAGVSARALRFLMLTCARTSEVRLARFDEIKDGVWTLPPERTKTGKAHRVPLCREAVAIVEACQGSEFLFLSAMGKPISDVAMSKFMRENGYDARPHGLRATFRTWAEETTDADHETKEACLGHAVDSGVVGAYQRSDRLVKRRALLATWEAFLMD